MSYRPAILLGLLVPLLIWHRSATRPTKPAEAAAAPMAAAKRHRFTPAPPLADLADATARGTRDSLRQWAAGLDDAEILEHLRTAVARVAADPTRSEEMFHLRPLLCALAMEGGRRDIEGFFDFWYSLDAAQFEGDLVYPALAGLAEIDPAGAWRRVQSRAQLALQPLPGGHHSKCPEITDHIFRLWARRDSDAAMAAFEEYVAEHKNVGEWDDHAVTALAAIFRVAGPEAVPGGLGGLLGGSGPQALRRRAELAAALAVHDLAAARDLVPGPEHTHRFIARWTHDDPDAALSFATSLGTQEALLAVAAGLLRDDPRRAMELLYSLGDPAAAKACLGSWQENEAYDGAWPVFEGAAPRVSRVTRHHAVLIGLHRLEQAE